VGIPVHGVRGHLRLHIVGIPVHGVRGDLRLHIVGIPVHGVRGHLRLHIVGIPVHGVMGLSISRISLVGGVPSFVFLCTTQLMHVGKL